MLEKLKITSGFSLYYYHQNTDRVHVNTFSITTKVWIMIKVWWHFDSDVQTGDAQEEERIPVPQTNLRDKYWKPRLRIPILLICGNVGSAFGLEHGHATPRPSQAFSVSAQGPSLLSFAVAAVVLLGLPPSGVDYQFINFLSGKWMDSMIDRNVRNFSFAFTPMSFNRNFYILVVRVFFWKPCCFHDENFSALNSWILNTCLVLISWQSISAFLTGTSIVFWRWIQFYFTFTSLVVLSLCFNLALFRSEGFLRKWLVTAVVFCVQIC